MPKAIIKSKTGSSITIEGTKEELAAILSDFERSSVVREIRTKATKSIVKKRDENKRRAASDLIVELREENFFSKPKTLGEIASKLEQMGYIYPTTTLSGVVIGLVQKKLLGRKKNDGKWVYGR
ncbi:MAG: hypothetical protein PHD51_02145 [Patescibacteria group bacterium]|nr:hypothetical protein [Patescibacteria group bacterium]MDD5490338.1 hypothetical protein [Patescibacteria group bacterium]